MKILALDPAKRTGWAWSDGSRIESGVWPLGNNPLATLADHIRAAAKRWGCEVIAYESATFGSRHLHVMRKHNELAGVIQLVASELAVPTWCYPPSQWKARGLGEGGADKRGVMRLLRIVHGIGCTDEDQADALGILMCARRGPPPEPVKKARRRAEKALKRRANWLF
jgi:Holliday junction resolvasome RuvABC endonuclease subunit